VTGEEEEGSEQEDISDEELEVEDLQRENESSESEEEAEGNNQDLTSASGLRWSRNPQRQAQGRQPVRNVFSERAGFRQGIHPRSRREAFLLVMQQTIDTAVLYTNVSGRRLVHQRLWHRTDTTEIEAFIGLHLLAGKY